MRDRSDIRDIFLRAEQCAMERRDMLVHGGDEIQLVHDALCVVNAPDRATADRLLGNLRDRLERG